MEAERDIKKFTRRYSSNMDKGIQTQIFPHSFLIVYLFILRERDREREREHMNGEEGAEREARENPK